MRWLWKTMVAMGMMVLFSGVAPASWVQRTVPTSVHLYGVTSEFGDSSLSRTWVCGEGGLILFTADAGLTWTQQPTGTQQTLRKIRFMENTPGTVIAIGDSGTVLRSTADGDSWVLLTSGTHANLNGLMQNHFTDYIAVGDQGTIIRTEDDGSTWQSYDSGTSLNLYGCGTVFSPTIVGQEGLILKSPDWGDSWQRIESGTEADLLDLPPLNYFRVMVGDQGTVLHFQFPPNWLPLSSGTTRRLNGAEDVPAHIYCVGEGGLVLKSFADTYDFGEQNSGTTENLNDVFFYLQNFWGWIVGDNGTVLYTEDGGGPIESFSSVGESWPPFDHHISVFPNPMSAGAEFMFSMPAGFSALARIYDVSGSLRREFPIEPGAGGQRVVAWEAGDLPAGVYFIRVETASGLVKKGRFTLLK